MKGMNFHTLTIAANIAAWILTLSEALTFQQSVADALTYLQNRAFPHATSQPGFDARMKAIDTLANLFTVLTYLQDLAPSHAALVLAVLLLTSQERDH